MGDWIQAPAGLEVVIADWTYPLIGFEGPRHPYVFYDGQLQNAMEIDRQLEIRPRPVFVPAEPGWWFLNNGETCDEQWAVPIVGWETGSEEGYGRALVLLGCGVAMESFDSSQQSLYHAQHAPRLLDGWTLDGGRPEPPPEPEPKLKRVVSSRRRRAA